MLVRFSTAIITSVSITTKKMLDDRKGTGIDCTVPVDNIGGPYYNPFPTPEMILLLSQVFCPNRGECVPTNTNKQVCLIALLASVFNNLRGGYMRCI